MKHLFVKKTIGSLFITVIAVGVFVHLTHPVLSVQPLNVKDTLSSSQLSYFATLGAGNTASSSRVKIGTSGPSQSTANLFVGDTVAIGTGSSMGSYIVKDVVDTTTFEVGVGLSANAVTTGQAVIATRSATHTISFTPQSAYGGDHWQFLIKTSNTSGETWNDGIPDQNGFDLGTLNAGAVSCPWSAIASVGTTAIISSGYPATANSYIVIDCSLGAGVFNPLTASTLTIGVGNSMLINPTRATGTSEGNANVLDFFIRHLDSTPAEIVADRAHGKVAVIESIQVSATVDPTLSFYIDTTNIGTTACGVSLKSDAYTNVTSTAVPFGSLGIGDTHTLAQRLNVVTNGISYVVTTYEGGPMTIFSASTGTTIPDTKCDGGGCSTITATEWSGYAAGVGLTSAGSYGLGYSLQNVNVGNSIFNYNNSGVFLAKPFGQGSSNAAAIMQRNSLPPTTETAYVCYRLRISSTQMAGDYQNKVVYVATATF